jgi:hypothetical protein
MDFNDAVIYMPEFLVAVVVGELVVGVFVVGAPDVVVQGVGPGLHVAESVGVVAAVCVDDCGSGFLVLLGESGRATSTPLFSHPIPDQQLGHC